MRSDALNSTMPFYEILDGLPPYGEAALPFPHDPRGAWREGLVVRFTDANNGSWVGNFLAGPCDFDFVETHPDQRRVIIVAGGKGYIIDPDTRALSKEFGWEIQQVHRLESQNLLLMADSIKIHVFTADHDWISEQISWDGFRDLAVNGTALCGQAWNVPEQAWQPFSLDLSSGIVTGAAYGANRRR